MSDVTIKIELNPDVHAELAAQARARGVPFDAFVQALLEQAVSPRPSNSTDLIAHERASAFHRWLEAFPHRRNTPLPDQALRRASFYSDERA